MKAKDTVIKLNCGGILSDIEVEYYNRGAAAQAEITFKLGVREVVEWSEELCGGHKDYEFSWIAIKLGAQRRECPICWQAKLKEWGIEK